MILLRQSTARTLLIGPFLDENDGKTAETALTVTQAEVRLSKNGGNMAQKNEATSLAHDELGYYTCLIDTTDTATLGILSLMIHESGALPVWYDYMVVPANVWDALFSTDKLQVDAVEISSDSTAADSLETAIEAGLATEGADGDTLETLSDQLDGVALDDQWTDARAGYLDNLSGGAVTAVGPTKAEMDAGHALLTTPAEVATELATYDGPTNAEMDAGHAALDTLLDRVLGLVHENIYQDSMTLDTMGRMTGGRLRTYDSKANADTHGATGLVSTYAITATYLGNNVAPATYLMTKE